MQLNAVPKGKENYIDVEVVPKNKPFVDKVIGKLINDNKEYLK